MADDNLLNGQGHTLRWTAENLVASVRGADDVTETYGYDGDGERVTRRRNGTTTFSIGGLYEEDSTPSGRRSYYRFHRTARATRQPSAAAGVQKRRNSGCR